MNVDMDTDYEVVILNVDEIESDDQDRQFDSDDADNPDLVELAKSIKTTAETSGKPYGVYQPISVYLDSSRNKYIIIQGESRWRSTRLAKLPQIPAMIRSKNNSLEQLAENIVRRDLNNYELSLALQKRLDSGFSLTEVANAIGRTKAYVSKYVRPFKMAEELQNYYRSKHITDIEILSKVHSLSINEYKLAIKEINKNIENNIKITKKIVSEIISLTKKLVLLNEELLRLHDKQKLTDLKLLLKINKLNESDQEVIINKISEGEEFMHLLEENKQKTKPKKDVVFKLSQDNFLKLLVKLGCNDIDNITEDQDALINKLYQIVEQEQENRVLQ